MSILGAPGSKVILLGNEAIARGAIEAGIGVAAAYPGTPSTEIVETLASIARDIGLYVEWSVNEKVAFEVAYGAAMCGIRALAAMKHVGVNVAKDTLMSSAYTGVKGGFVIVSADDPSCHSSQNEQDNRILGFHAYIPVFEPYSPGEAKELTRFLFYFSEKFESPVILRTTTRISHARGVVVLGKPEKPKVKGYFSKEDVERWILVPVNARRQRRILVEKWSRIKREVDNLTDFNILHYNSSRKTIIASGLAYSYVYEVLSDSNLLGKVNLLKISSVVPIPNGLTRKALEDVDSVLVVEELEPVVEVQVKNLIVDNGLNVKVYGKNLVPLTGELTLERVAKAIGKFLDTQLSITTNTSICRSVEFKVPPRPPTFCPGCPHRATYYALKRVIQSLNVKAVYLGDIGCYTLGYLSPFRLLDTCICMGASIGVACGVSKAISGDTLVVALIGDSTFYHAGIPPLVNALYNRAPMLILVFDNLWTAMTGHQPHPGTGVNATGGKAKVIPIEDIAKTMGVDYVKVVSSYNIVELESTLREAIECVRRGGVAVVISRGECRLVTLRRLRRGGVKTPVFYVDSNLCTKCYTCVNEFMCPAIQID
ncbi:MAG TPA: indolepyruvate ferredoxin oxidoreductase subunit alpha, partial [Desulfurococcales archaeon]|nr:indolepyruvate ferredoxin oxidoreductase subunit alpha [Desulfurococcales archaeon]